MCARAPTGASPNSAWPNLNGPQWIAGSYALNYNVQDWCYRTTTVTATLNLVCNNPPRILVPSGNQTVTLRYGAEVRGVLRMPVYYRAVFVSALATPATVGCG